MTLPSGGARIYGASPMRRLFLALVAVACVLPIAPFACDDTPRGEQGIDYLDDGSYYTVPPGPEAGADVYVPCVEDTDAGMCAQASSPTGTAATHLIVCTGGQTPAGIACVEPGDGSVTDAGTFCCTTGIL